MLFSLRIPKNVDTLNSLKAVNFGEFIRWGQQMQKNQTRERVMQHFLSRAILCAVLVGFSVAGYAELPTQGQGENTQIRSHQPVLSTIFPQFPKILPVKTAIAAENSFVGAAHRRRRRVDKAAKVGYNA